MGRLLLVAAGALTASALACSLASEGIPAGTSSATSSGATSDGGGGAAASSGSSAGGSTTTATASGSGSGSGAGPAICEGGYECVPAATAGVYVRVADATGMTCPPEWMDPVSYGDGVQPGCSACSCGPPAGGCLPGPIHGYTGPGCSNALADVILAPFDCYSLASNDTGFLLQPSTPTQVACAPGPSAPNPLPGVTLCTAAAPPARPCGSGGVCVPAGNAAFGKICNLLPEGETCAPGWTAQPDVAAILDPTLACACACGAASGEACTGANVVYWATGNDTCSGASLGSLAGDGICHATTQTTTGSMWVDPGSVTGGSCAASQVGDETVTFGPMETLCCTQAVN